MELITIYGREEIVFHMPIVVGGRGYDPWSLGQLIFSPFCFIPGKADSFRVIKYLERKEHNHNG